MAEVEWILREVFEELTSPKFSIVAWAARSRNRGLWTAARSSDAEVRFPKVLPIGDAKSLYDHLRTETSGGANDMRTGIDIQILRASMDAQGVTVRWVDNSGMYADAMTKKNGDVPLLQMLMRTGRICITEESVTLVKQSESLVAKQFVLDASRSCDASCDGWSTEIDHYLLMDVRISV